MFKRLWRGFIGTLGCLVLRRHVHCQECEFCIPHSTNNPRLCHCARLRVPDPRVLTLTPADSCRYGRLRQPQNALAHVAEASEANMVPVVGTVKT